jgi:oxygen-independent coproporphyrinogen-3 oxidase
VTIYQMELPFNTTISADILKGTGQFHESVATWATRRRWMRQAFDGLESAGYTAGSAYTAVKDPAKTKFVYRDRLWQGADLVALGVASFGHVNGVHMQNLDAWDPYAAALDKGELPLGRAYQPTAEERMIREFVLQLKRGSIRPAYFQDKYKVDVLRRFPSQLAALRAEGFLASSTTDLVKLSREGLLRVDSLLPRFFLPEHMGVRYT